MKNNLIYIIVGILFVWNVVLSLRHEKTEPLPQQHDFAVYDSLYARHERIISELSFQIDQLDTAIVRDSIKIINSDRAYRDSLRKIFNP